MSRCRAVFAERKVERENEGGRERERKREIERASAREMFLHTCTLYAYGE
jgi:hypothetical protein